MTTIDKSGVSVEEIIRNFRREHNISDHELYYEIIKKPSKGFLGLFANKIALVRFQLPEPEDRIRLFLETLLSKMGISFAKMKTRKEGKTLFITIEGIVETGFVIGKNGSMLETIQYFINRVFESDNTFERIYVDANGYRQRKENQFLDKFLPQFKKIKLNGKAITLEPMNPAERRIIHRHIEKQRGLKTLTIGEGEIKRIVVFSAKQKESEVLKNPKPAQAKEKETKVKDTVVKENVSTSVRPKRNRRPQKKTENKPSAVAKTSDTAKDKPEPSPKPPRKSNYRPRRKNNKTQGGDS